MNRTIWSSLDTPTPDKGRYILQERLTDLDTRETYWVNRNPFKDQDKAIEYGKMMAFLRGGVWRVRDIG